MDRERSENGEMNASEEKEPAPSLTRALLWTRLLAHFRADSRPHESELTLLALR
jgi:hypothetical protein